MENNYLIEVRSRWGTTDAYRGTSKRQRTIQKRSWQKRTIFGLDFGMFKGRSVSKLGRSKYEFSSFG